MTYPQQPYPGQPYPQQPYPQQPYPQQPYPYPAPVQQPYPQPVPAQPPYPPPPGVPAPEPAKPPQHRIVPAPGTRLEQLSDLLEEAKAAKKAAEERETAISAAMKAEATRAAPAGAVDIVIAGSADRPPWRVHYVPTSRLDTKRIRAERPDITAEYEVPGGTWKCEKA